VTAISATGLSKTFPRLFGTPHEALRSLTLTIPRGSAFGLIGPNGAGKTTFIKLLLGVARPTDGEVQVLGSSPEERSVRAKIGYLPERLHLPGAWTPVQFLGSVARLKGVTVDAGLLERVGLAGASGRKIGAFSKGMRQRLGLAAALLGKPELLVLDEPTDGIDPLGRVEVRQILLEEKARGATVLLNSHLLAETERVCDRVGILNLGRLVREGTLESLTAAREGWDVEFAAGANVEQLAALGFVQAGGAWLFHGTDLQALNAAIAKAREGGALLTALAARTWDLEQVLSESLK
jgi:ABC-2 type transport system ATP-binding protein